MTSSQRTAARTSALPAAFSGRREPRSSKRPAVARTQSKRRVNKDGPAWRRAANSRATPVPAPPSAAQRAALPRGSLPSSREGPLPSVFCVASPLTAALPRRCAHRARLRPARARRPSPRPLGLPPLVGARGLRPLRAAGPHPSLCSRPSASARRRAGLASCLAVRWVPRLLASREL